MAYIRDLLTPYPDKGLAAFSDETVDSRGDDGQRYRAELEHGIVERANVNFAPSVFSAFSRARAITSSPI
jgi:hypothetical protein